MPRNLAASAWVSLASHYTEAHRHYHNLTHIDRMLSYLDSVAPGHIAIELAIWFHDVIYNPLARDNEARSADFFVEQFGNTVTVSLAETVHRLIIATDPKRSRSGEADENLLIDIDLSILGSPPEYYEKYVTTQVSFTAASDSPS